MRVYPAYVGVKQWWQWVTEPTKKRGKKGKNARQAGFTKRDQRRMCDHPRTGHRDTQEACCLVLHTGLLFAKLQRCATGEVKAQR